MEFMRYIVNDYQDREEDNTKLKKEVNQLEKTAADLQKKSASNR